MNDKKKWKKKQSSQKELKYHQYRLAPINHNQKI